MRRMRAALLAILLGALAACGAHGSANGGAGDDGGGGQIKMGLPF
jgi:hypothetical protein